MRLRKSSRMGMTGVILESMWSSTPPSLDGYYWWRFSESDGFPDIVQLCEGKLYYFQTHDLVGECIYPIEECIGEFLGPIILQHTTIDETSHAYNNL